MCSWLYVNKAILTTQGASRMLAARVLTCIINNDGSGTCGGVRSLPYKVWDSEEDVKTEFESIHLTSFLWEEICCLSFLTTEPQTYVKTTLKYVIIMTTTEVYEEIGHKHLESDVASALSTTKNKGNLIFNEYEWFKNHCSQQRLSSISNSL